MKLSTKILSLVLATLFVLSAFCGCDTGSGNGEVTTTAPGDVTTSGSVNTPPEDPALPVVINASNAAEYTVIRPDGATADMRTVYASFRTELSSKLGVEFKISDDWTRNPEDLPESAKEIVLGTTNRPGTEEIASQLREKDFAIVYKNERIYIIGGTDAKTTEALTYFLEKYVNADTQTLTVNTKLSDFVIYTYPIQSIEVNGVNLRDYTIVIPKEADLFTQYAAENLSNYLEANAGYELEIVTDATAAVQYEILIGDTNRPESSTGVTAGEGEYVLFTSNSKIVCTGESYMVGGGVGALVSRMPAGGSDTKISITDLPTTAKAEKFTFKEAKNAVLMIGDGMGFNTVEMAFAKLGGSFVAEALPNKGSCVTASLNTLANPTKYTDSAASATALSSGYKTYNGYLGINGSKVKKQNIRELADSKGAMTGVITTDVITGATPSGFLAHHDSRSDTAILQSQIDELIANGSVDWCVGKIDNKLTSNSADALKTLSAGDSSFFLMIEGALIDKRSHSNDAAGCIDMVERFNDCIAYVIEFVLCHPDTVLIVTADHECGGIVKNADGSFSYTSDNHTTADVPTYAIGTGTEFLNGKKIDNTDIPKFIATIFGENNFGS